MSRIPFVIGLAVSVVFHWWLLAGLGIQQADRVSLESLVAVDILEMQEKSSMDTSKDCEEQKYPASAKSEKKIEDKTIPVSEPKVGAVQSAPQAKIQMEPSQEQLYSATTEKGSFAGSPDGEDMPLLRINWGQPDEALAILQMGGMKLILLNAELDIKAELSYQEGKWSRETPSFKVQTVYSSNLRIVDRVSAFQWVMNSNYLKTDEHLAVMIPMKLETVIESEKMKAAFHRGLTFNMIKTFGGYFYLKNDQVFFKIDKIQERG